MSETLEKLLAAFVGDTEAKTAQRKKRVAAHIAASDAFVAKYGSLADAFSTL